MQIRREQQWPVLICMMCEKQFRSVTANDSILHTQAEFEHQFARAQTIDIVIHAFGRNETVLVAVAAQQIIAEYS